MNPGVKALRSLLGRADVPTAAERAQAGKGVWCGRCGTAIETRIPLRYCPRCGVRFPNVPPDPELEPLEAIEEKIGQSRFRQAADGRWSWPGWAVGTALGLMVGAGYLDWFARPDVRVGWKVAAVFAWSALLGGLAGSALGVLYRALVRPVLVAVVSSRRFEEEYGEGPARERAP